ncbi:hypothetical protein SAMN05428961_10498 [Paenibacillus sp. OK060]|nr:hypothetical protein SAMN05428961_10498 [Paenibacillus sp. OK060]
MLGPLEQITMDTKGLNLKIKTLRLFKLLFERHNGISSNPERFCCVFEYFRI